SDIWNDAQAVCGSAWAEQVSAWAEQVIEKRIEVNAALKIIRNAPKPADEKAPKPADEKAYAAKAAELFVAIRKLKNPQYNSTIRTHFPVGREEIAIARNALIQFFVTHSQSPDVSSVTSEGYTMLRRQVE